MIPPYLVSHVFPRPVVTRLNDSIQAVFTETAIASMAFKFFPAQFQGMSEAAQAADAKEMGTGDVPLKKRAAT